MKTVNIVRDRPNVQALADELLSLGATVVTTEDDLQASLRASGLAPPQLALNCVGGSSATAVAKTLGSAPACSSTLQDKTVPIRAYACKILHLLM